MATPLAIKSLDFETYSEAGYIWSSVKSYTAGGKEKPGWFLVQKSKKSGLGCVGAYCYAEHPSTEVLSLDYDGTLWVPGMPRPEPLIQHILAGGLVEAHNSFFEFVIWHFVCHLRLGWPPLPLSQLRCTMSRCHAWGLPGALAVVSKILQLQTPKDIEGHKIMMTPGVSRPRDPTQKDSRLRFTPADSPDMFRGLYSYNSTDTASERELSTRVPELSGIETQVWLLDQRINVRGIGADTPAIRGGRQIMADLEAEKLVQLQVATNGYIKTGGQIDKFREFLGLHGVAMDNMKAPTVQAALDRTDLPPVAREVLELRQALSLASVKKLAAMDNNTASDGRMHDLFTYSGATRTQRWSGHASQPHNLTKDGPQVVKRTSDGARFHLAHGADMQFAPGFESAQWDIDAVEQCLVDIRSGNLNRLRDRWGDPALAISGCIRGMHVAGPGKELIGTDYDSIEARVLAVLAGEEWRLEVFRTHGKIYEMTASQVSGVPLEEILAYKDQHAGQHHPLRKLGKVGELASGFQGAVGAWLRFGAGKFMSEDEIEAAVKMWRASNPMIVKLWKEAERCAIDAVCQPGIWQNYREIGYYYEQTNDVLYCRLPSGRYLSYHAPRLAPGMYDSFDITYMTKHQTSGAWIRQDGYGGMFVENFVQAAARDILAWGMLQIDLVEPYEIVLHVHDEPVCEVPEGQGSPEEVEKILSILPPYAAHWPISASGGWRGKRFRKD